jgi:hypothetical protein
MLPRQTLAKREAKMRAFYECWKTILWRRLSLPEQNIEFGRITASVMEARCAMNVQMGEDRIMALS